MLDTRLSLMCGIDIPIPECQLVIHQPRIKEIAYIGEKEFFIGVQTLCVDKKMLVQDKPLPANINNFQIFMTIMSEQETADKKQPVKDVLTLFFPNYKVFITPRSLSLMNKDNTSVVIDENNFDFLQKAISTVCCLVNNSDQTNFNPANKKAAEIAAKIMRGRQRVAEQNGEANASTFTSYLSSLTIGLNSMSLFELMDLTIFQLYDLVQRYMLYIDWDLDIRSRLAGAKSDSKPENWMKNIH